jgi:hypothetical protein
MEENKRKEIEAKLFKLIAETNQKEEPQPAARKKSAGIKVIRRRKGTADTHIA